MQMCYKQAYEKLTLLGYTIQNSSPLLLTAIHAYLKAKLEDKPDLRRLQNSTKHVAFIKCPKCNGVGSITAGQVVAQFACVCGHKLFAINLYDVRTQNVLAKLLHVTKTDYKEYAQVHQKPTELVSTTTQHVQAITTHSTVKFYTASREALLSLPQCRVKPLRAYLDVSAAGTGKTRRTATFDFKTRLGLEYDRHFLVVKSAQHVFKHTPELISAGWQVLPGRAKEYHVLKVLWQTPFGRQVQLLPDCLEVREELSKYQEHKEQHVVRGRGRNPFEEPLGYPEEDFWQRRQPDRIGYDEPTVQAPPPFPHGQLRPGRSPFEEPVGGSLSIDEIEPYKPDISKDNDDLFGDLDDLLTPDPEDERKPKKKAKPKDLQVLWLESLDIGCINFDKIYQNYNHRDRASLVLRLKEHCSLTGCKNFETCHLRNLRSALLNKPQAKLVTTLKALSGIKLRAKDILEIDDCEVDELAMVANEAQSQSQEDQLSVQNHLLPLLAKLADSEQPLQGPALAIKLLASNLRMILNVKTKQELASYIEEVSNAVDIKTYLQNSNLQGVLITRKIDQLFITTLFDHLSYSLEYLLSSLSAFDLEKHERLVFIDLLVALFSEHSSIVLDLQNKTVTYKYLGELKTTCPILINNANGYENYYRIVFPQHQFITYKIVPQGLLNDLGINTQTLTNTSHVTSIKLVTAIEDRLSKQTLPHVVLHRLPPVYATNYENAYVTLSTVLERITDLDRAAIAVYKPLYEAVNTEDEHKLIEIFFSHYPSLETWLRKIPIRERLYTVKKIIADPEGAAQDWQKNIYTKYMEFITVRSYLKRFNYVFNMHNARGDNTLHKHNINTLVILGEPLRDIPTAKALDGNDKARPVTYRLPNGKYLTCFDATTAMRRYITSAFDQLTGRLRQAQHVEKLICHIAGSITEIPVVGMTDIIDYPLVRLTPQVVKRAMREVSGLRIYDSELQTYKPLIGNTALGLTNLLKLLVVASTEDLDEEKFKQKCTILHIGFYHYTSLLQLQSFTSQEIYNQITKLLQVKYELNQHKLAALLNLLDLAYIMKPLKPKLNYKQRPKFVVKPKTDFSSYPWLKPPPLQL